MQSITARDRDAGVDGLSLTDMAYPHAAENDVVVRVHAAGFTRGELDWAGTWSDRAGRDRTPTVPGHELSGVVAELGFGTTGLTVGQRVFGLADWTRNGSLAEYAAVEARNLAPLPADVDHTLAAALPISGLTARQGLFDHARLTTGQTVLIHGAAGSVGSIAVQLASDAGAFVIGTGRAADRDTALGLGADVFLDLQVDGLENAGEWTWCSTSSVARSSNARPSWSAPAARWSPSQHRPPSSPTTGGPCSSSCNPTVRNSWSLLSGSETAGSSRSWAPCGPSPRRPPHSRPTGVRAARRSSGSHKRRPEEANRDPREP